MCEKLTIKLGSEDAQDLIKSLKENNIEFSTKGKAATRFLPSPWMEITIALTSAVLPILYDFWKSRKNKSKAIIYINNESMQLNAENIKKLELRLKKRENESSTCSEHR